ASVQLLLDAGADAGARNNKREQAIHLAEQAENASIIEALNTHENQNGLFGFIACMAGSNC
ncbi:MAG: hypothetical protein WBO18_04395, partial [Gammaproteobacteria bacterium]